MKCSIVFLGIDVHGDAKEHKVLKFLVFHDGTTFVFYGACSLREHIQLNSDAMHFIQTLELNVEHETTAIIADAYKYLQCESLPTYVSLPYFDIKYMSVHHGIDEKHMIDFMKSTDHKFVDNPTTLPLWRNYMNKLMI